MIKKLVLGLLFLLVATFGYCEDDLLKVRIALFDGGQDSFDLSDAINPNQGVSFVNTILNKKGQLFKRLGNSLFANDISNTAFTGLGTFYPDTNTKYIISASGPSVIRSTSAGINWSVANPSNNLTSGKNTEFVQANLLLFILNGQDPTANYNGSSWDPGSLSAASPPVATTAAWLRNYLFLAGNPTYIDWIYFSNNLAPTLFTSTDIIKVNTGDGQRILKLESFKLNELIVYKERSIYVLDITGTTPLTDWTLQPISKSIGLAAPRSVVSVNNDQWFLSSEPFAVRSLVRSTYDKILVEILSKSIQDLFDGTGDVTINKTYISKACAVLYDNKYFLAVPVGNSTYNNYVVVYDFITNSWSILEGWYPAAWTVFNNNLYYIDATDGRVVQCFSNNIGDLTSGPGVTSASEPLVPITYTYTSKNIDFDNSENYKQLDSLDVEFEATGTYNASVYIELDNSGWQNIGTISLSGGGIALPAYLPFTLSPSGVARKTFQVQRYGEFKKIKVKIVQDGLNELCNLHSFTIYAKMKNWRRE